MLMNKEDILFYLIIALIVGGACLFCYFVYKLCANVEPDEPDAVRLGIIPPVVIHADARIVPIQTTATYSGPPDHYVHDAVYVEELKEAEPPMGENMV